MGTEVTEPGMNLFLFDFDAKLLYNILEVKGLRYPKVIDATIAIIGFYVLPRFCVPEPTDLQYINLLKWVIGFGEGSIMVSDRERSPLEVIELGTCDKYPQSLKHNPNGRFVFICGDGGPNLVAILSNSLNTMYEPVLKDQVDEFLPHASRAETRGKFRKEGVAQRVSDFPASLGRTCGTTYWITPVRHEAADAESNP
ncbi:hypothetical protein CTI12_AA137810 [Artemisia annua]|uniref:Uncharacterized protein n=1 Tax=Artemisia annua TaxID=35608 RepID=A0A2U1PM04_ARTAN|nr:hypothetical protein CTI12_AA137810 [Artemisia annua]